MARARNIKPGLYKNEDLAECSVWARLIFPGLWMLADREGRLEDRPKRIKGELLPYDSVEVEPLLDELAQFGFIQRYQVDGKPYIQVTKFLEHQTPHVREQASTIPAPPESVESTAKVVSSTILGSGEPSPRSPDSLIPSSLITDSVPSQAPPPAKKNKKSPKTPMPEGFGVSDRVKEWARKKGYGRLEQHLENFVFACEKHGYVYANWDSAFMDAIRDDWAKLGQAPPEVKPVVEQVPSLAEITRRSEASDKAAEEARQKLRQLGRVRSGEVH